MAQVSITDTILNLTTRSWLAFWATVLVCGTYALWNVLTGVKFDPYPFIFLTLLLTFFSYLQNIIIMTIQRQQESLQEKQAKYTLHLMEAVSEQLKILSEARLLEIKK